MIDDSHNHPLRVAIAAYDDDKAVSGPVSWVTRVPALMRDRGVDVRVLLLHWGCGVDGRVWRALRKQGVPCVTQRFSSTEENTTWLFDHVRSNNSDIFIANHVFPALLIGGLLRRCGIPSVGILRSDDKYYHGVIERFANGRPQDRLSACVCVSQFLADLVGTNTNLALRVIPSGTPDSGLLTTWKSGIRLIYTGRLEQEQKRILDTVRAIIEAVRQVPGTTAVIVGEGTQEANVKALVTESGLPIRVTGGIDPEHVRSELLESQVHVLFSDYEGLPTAVVEAMACGVVPVCSRMRSGIPELIIHGETGFILDRPIEELPRIVRELSRNHGVWERISAAARLHFKNGFSSDSVADRWLMLCRQLLSNAESRGNLRLRQGDLCLWDERFAPEDSRGNDRGTGARYASVLRLAKRVLGKILPR